MKFKKLVFIMALILCIGSISSAYATNDDSFYTHKISVNQIRWEYVMSINTSVGGSESEVKANAVITTRDNTSINGRMYLQKYINGSWKSLKSWKVKGSTFIKTSKTYNGGVGKYRTKVSINAGGEDITVYSSTNYID